MDESWTIKKAECQRIDAFELWCWRRLLKVPWSARRSNQSVLNEINPEYSLEGLMLKLKLQYFGHLMWRTNSLEKTLMLGKIESGGEGDNRGWDGWMASLTQWICIWVGSRSLWLTQKPGVLQSIGSQRVRHNWVTELNWTEVLGLNITWMMGLLLMDPLKDRWGICFRIVVGQRLSALVSDVFSFRGKVQVSTWNPRAHVLLHLQVTLKNYIF